MITNKRASFDYTFLDKYDAGLILSGEDVKFIRNGRGVSFNGAFCSIKENEISVYGLNIANKNHFKLLLTKRELKRLKNDLIKGLTIVPYKLYESKSGRFKLEIHLARGNKQYDKRELIKERDIKRESNDRE
jgi:SsrA-binding protein